MVGMGLLFGNRRLRKVSSADLVPVSREDWLLAPDDLLFGRRSLTLAGAGKCTIVKDSDQALTFESSLIRVRLDVALGVPDFYFYFFESSPGRQLMSTIVEQTAVAGIRSSDLRRLVVPTPPLDEQRRIAEVLGALDDLIDTNDSQISRLRALQAGVVLQLSQTADRAVSLGSIAAVGREKASGDAETPYLGLEHFAEGGRGISSIGRLGEVGGGQQSFRRGDLLYGRLRPYFRKVDRVGFDGACTGEIWVLRPTGAIPLTWLAGIITSNEFTDFAMAGSEGTKMPRAKWDHVARYQVPVPSAEKLSTLNSVLEGMWEQIWALQEENEQLRRTRDELLPLLMSGAVRVRPEGVAA